MRLTGEEKSLRNRHLYERLQIEGLKEINEAVLVDSSPCFVQGFELVEEKKRDVRMAKEKAKGQTCNRRTKRECRVSSAGGTSANRQMEQGKRRTMAESRRTSTKQHKLVAFSDTPFSLCGRAVARAKT